MTLKVNAYTYIGETWQKFTTCLKEHKKEQKSWRVKTRTLSRKRENNQSKVSQLSQTTYFKIIMSSIGIMQKSFKWSVMQVSGTYVNPLDQEKRNQSQEL